MSEEWIWNDFLSEMRSAGYSMDEISDKWEDVKEGDADPEDFLEVENEEEEESSSSEQEDSEEFSQESSSEEETVSFADAIGSNSTESEEDEENDVEEEDSSSSDSPEGSSSEASMLETSQEGGSMNPGSGWAESINQGWGMLWASDKEVGTKEWEDTTEKIATVAEQANLGENMSWYIRENLMSEKEDDPKSALMMSLLMAAVMTLPQRPDAVKRIKNELQNGSRSKNKSEESKEDDE